MEICDAFPNLGAVYAALACGSTRPRYSFMVLQLVAEIADAKGLAGPFVMRGEGELTLRDWLCAQLMPMSERDDRRAALRARVLTSIQSTLTGDPALDQQIITAAVEEQVREVGRANISRAISDLVRLGLLKRHYAGYATNHFNRGGRRHAVYVITPTVMKALGKSPVLPAPIWRNAERQGQLFAV
jgi:hypothetical protein